MNTGITLTEVRSEAMDVIKLLKKGEIDVKTASEIRSLLNTIIDTGKTQVEFLKALPAHIKETIDETTIKAIAGTLKDRDAELEVSLNEIDNKKKAVYNL